MPDTATFDLEPVLTRLAAIHRRALVLREEAAADRTAGDSSGHTFDLAAIVDKPIPSRLGRVCDARTGIAYAAWVIGETLCAIGGFDAFDDRHGTRAAVWLDHRWNGVQVGGDVWCC